MKFADIQIIFDDSPISRSYLECLKQKNLTKNKIIYLNKKSILPNKFNSLINFKKNNFYPIQLLKKKEMLFFVNQVEEFFELERGFVKSMYNINNLSYFENIDYINNNSINSKEIVKHLFKNNHNYYLNTTKQILKEIFDTNKKFYHIHPGYLPKVKGADASLHSIDKFNELASTSFEMNKKIDEGPIIARTKMKFPKFKLKNIAQYKLKDLYRIWYSFVDPILRMSHLKFLIENHVDTQDIKNISYDQESSNYYTFMNDNELLRTFNKIFVNI